MSTPELSSLQAAVLDALSSKDLSGRELREALEKAGIKKNGPAFYQMMARLEEAKFVIGRYDEKMVGGQRIKERRYIMTGEGSVALRDVAKFYAPIVAKYEIS